MKILLINKFLYRRGGDAVSLFNTADLLLKNGHEVFYWGMSHPKNSEFPFKEYFVPYVDYDHPLGVKREFGAALNIFYSFEAKKKINAFLKIRKPDVVHLFNFAHQISPSILDVFKRYNIPVIMTACDYKLVCPSYTMYSKGKPCEKCKGARFYQCFINKCTKNSYAKSLINAAEMYLHHKVLRIYDKIDLFISPSAFLKDKIYEMGFKRQVIHLTNFIDSGDYIPDYNYPGDEICYCGRLSLEKGLFTLLDAVKNSQIRLKIVGDGPIRADLEQKINNEKITNVRFTGYRSGEELKEEIRNSRFLVIPSECYENSPLSVLEAFALGKPVIGASIGGIPELVKDGETGYTFKSGDVEALRNKILMLKENKDKLIMMGKDARKYVEENFNSEKHYQGLTKIYQLSIKKNN